MEAGASIERVHQALFSSGSLARLRLLGGFFSGLQTDVSGRLIWGIIGQADLTRYNVTSADVEGLVEEELTVAGTELAVLFLEELGDTVRISLRSRNGIRVDGLARSLGGGGHAQAAGARLSAPLEKVVQRTLEAARAELLEDVKIYGRFPS
jgi:phosphoesterase RecJ-like protein